MKGRAPTKADIKRFELIQSMGCIVCILFYGAPTPCEIHHTNGKTKEGAHQLTIGLCPGHHRHGSDKPPFISRHPYKARFEAAYGTEAELLVETNERLEYPF